MTDDNKALYYLADAPVPKAIIHMAIPMMLGMLVNLIYNITDAYFIGLLGDTSALAAVSLALPITTVLMALGELFGTGGSTYISRLLGENRADDVRRTAAVVLYLSLFSGVAFMALSLPLLTPALSILGAAADSIAPTRAYILPFLIGAPAVIASFTLGQTVRGEGAASESMIGMMISVVANILLDPVFIFLFGMGVEGAAVATVVGNLLGTVYYLWYLGRVSPFQSVSPRDFRPNREMLSNIFKIGLSAFLLACFLVVTCLLFNHYAMLYGDYVVAASGVANRICQVSEFIGMGLYMGIVPLIAYAYAAGNTPRLERILKTTLTYLLTLVTGISLMLFCFSHQVIGFFSQDPAVLSVGAEILAALLASTLFTVLTGLLTSMFQAFGKGMQSNVLSVARGMALIPVIMAGHRLFGLDGVIWSLTVSEFCAFAVGLWLWSTSKGQIMNTPLSERAAFDPECV